MTSRNNFLDQILGLHRQLRSLDPTREMMDALRAVQPPSDALDDVRMTEDLARGLRSVSGAADLTDAFTVALGAIRKLNDPWRDLERSVRRLALGTIAASANLDLTDAFGKVVARDLRKLGGLAELAKVEPSLRPFADLVEGLDGVGKAEAPERTRELAQQILDWVNERREDLTWRDIGILLGIISIVLTFVRPTWVDELRHDHSQLNHAQAHLHRQVEMLSRTVRDQAGANDAIIAELSERVAELEEELVRDVVPGLRLLQKRGRLRTRPRGSSVILRTLEADSLVYLVERRGRWSKVRVLVDLDTEVEGWLRTSALGKTARRSAVGPCHP